MPIRRSLGGLYHAPDFDRRPLDQRKHVALNTLARGITRMLRFIRYQLVDFIDKDYAILLSQGHGIPPKVERRKAFLELRVAERHARIAHFHCSSHHRRFSSARTTASTG
jgi:hypothetical protein